MATSKGLTSISLHSAVWHRLHGLKTANQTWDDFLLELSRDCVPRSWVEELERRAQDPLANDVPGDRCCADPALAERPGLRSDAHLRLPSPGEGGVRVPSPSGPRGVRPRDPVPPRAPVTRGSGVRRREAAERSRALEGEAAPPPPKGILSRGRGPPAAAGVRPTGRLLSSAPRHGPSLRVRLGLDFRECELGEKDQLNFVGQLVDYGTVPNNGGIRTIFPVPTGSCTAWTVAYGSVKSEDGVSFNVVVPLGLGQSLSFAFGANSQWSSTTTKSVTWVITDRNPEPAVCEEFVDLQDYSGSLFFGYSSVSMHIYDTGLSASC